MYEPSRHLCTFNIAGFQFWDGALVLDDLHAGAQLQLVAEPDNPHDPAAVAIYFGGSKLGFVPADENDLASRLIHFGHADVLECRVLSVDPTKSPWKQVMAGIYLTDVREGE